MLSFQSNSLVGLVTSYFASITVLCAAKSQRRLLKWQNGEPTARAVCGKERMTAGKAGTLLEMIRSPEKPSSRAFWARPRIRKSTSVYYKMFIDTHIRPKLGDIKLYQLHTMDIQRLYNELRENGRIRKEIKDKQPGNPYLLPVAVPGVFFARRSGLESRRPLPLAHLASSAPGGARIAPPRR